MNGKYSPERLNTTELLRRKQSKIGHVTVQVRVCKYSTGHR